MPWLPQGAPSINVCFFFADGEKSLTNRESCLAWQFSAIYGQFDWLNYPYSCYTMLKQSWFNHVIRRRASWKITWKNVPWKQEEAPLPLSLFAFVCRHDCMTSFFNLLQSPIPVYLYIYLETCHTCQVMLMMSIQDVCWCVNRNNAFQLGGLAKLRLPW